ncbi:hypothetical protein CO046_00590 [Candidatus Peregrinibacteria bacterium CG_4_9_14_0_2_um_filter_53_11]|nr:MAG: hypothetical protein CO046_00590 [Candidatus Peregrinibacteria bacterium CG_4_9_14_0_2_um_filter_53_11]
MRLQQDEVIISESRRHLTPYILRLIGVLVLTIPIIIFLVILAQSGNEDLIFYLISLTSFIVGAIVAVISIDYLLDKLILTNKRIILIDWRSLLNRVEHEIGLDEIQKITISRPGIFEHIPFLNFGEIEIESSASKPSISFPNCKSPEDMQECVLRESHKREREILNHGSTGAKA